MPSLRACEILIAIAEEHSISRAARRLHLSQPAVSHQLSGLEREVGVPLVDRGPRGVNMTPEGREFLGHARRAIDAADQAVAAARAGSAMATIRLAAAESFTMPFVVPVARRWNTEGRSSLTLTETTSAEAAIDALRLGAQDVVLVPGPLPALALHVEILAREDIVVVMPDGLARDAAPLSFEDVAAHPLVGVDASNGFGEWISRRFADAGIAHRATLQTRSLHTAAALASAGFGMAVVPRSATDPGMSLAALAPALDRPILAITRSTPRGVVADLVEALRRECELFGG